MHTGTPSQRPRSSFLSMAAVVLLAWAGMVVHNLADLPISLFSPENTLPGLVWLALLLLWGSLPFARWPAALLLAWGTLNLVGAILTVLPLSLLPFAPEQSLRHYLFHGLYAATQLPLLHHAQADWRRSTAPSRIR